ncbi:zona pellucida sperm-binding protein 3d.2 [Hoplias malabaricus]|uniref:zona pellucida sperm-binding protein 3d.2 n=1 Tax=Hoplias malabaricus TaxID=27720 RepID=UPI00346314BB
MGQIFPPLLLIVGLLWPRARAEGSPSSWAELAVPEQRETELGPAPLRLPGFVHSRVPLVDRTRFAPARASESLTLSERVRKVLVPVPEPTRADRTDTGPNRVRVICNSKQMRVKVPVTFLGSGSGLRLGSCAASRSTEEHVLFLNNLQQCGTTREIINNQVVYSNTLHYSPPDTEGSDRDSPGFSVPVHCHFNRFHYSYKIGFVPNVETQKIFKPMKVKTSSSLSLHDAKWRRLDFPRVYLLGRPMFLEAKISSVAEGERLYLSSCHVTANSSLFSTPQVTVINNYGCFVDSRSSSGSKFIASSRRNVVRFSLGTFTFKGISAKELYIHCETSVSSENPTETTKFCSYNQQENRWEELYGSDSVCSCCNATCPSSAPTESKKSEQKEYTPETRRLFEEVFGLD